jgi:type II secretory pathway pseudopilin PulG
MKTTAFTILEILVVIGIIAILAVMLLVALNPTEAQRRSRDTQRLKDITTLQSLVEQHLLNGNAPTGCAASAPCYSSSIPGLGPQSCSTNWMGLNFCTNAPTVPTDPLNGTAVTCLDSETTTTDGCVMRYRLIFAGSNYELSTMLESKTNGGKVVNDGGTSTNANSLYQIFSQGELTTNLFTVAGGSPDSY